MHEFVDRIVLKFIAANTTREIQNGYETLITRNENEQKKLRNNVS